MRGIGYTLSRLPTARALLAGAAILAGAFTSAAHGQVSGSGNGTGTQATDNRAEEAAFANPRIPHADAPGVAFPEPLRPSDVALIRRVFAFQSHGNIPAAIRDTAELENPLLTGEILADRYLGPYHHSTIPELTDWLSRYENLPEASAIHALLVTRLPNNAAVPEAPPDSGTLRRAAEIETIPEDIDPPRSAIVRNPILDRNVMDRAQRGDVSSALRTISMARGIAPGYAALLRAEVAQVLFTRNEDREALRVAQMTLAGVKPADQPSLAFYIGGLAAWRLDRNDLARSLFEGGAQAENTSARVRAASAFWASRANRRMHDAAATVKWLRVAAKERFTLHGLLARRILRLDTGIIPSGALLGQADVDAVAATTAGWRAFALLQVGQTERAEQELRSLWGDAKANPVFGRALMMVAASAGMTDCAAQMAASLQSQDGRRHDELRFPIPRLRPAGGFKIDPTLVYALTRLESNFNTNAISPVGARGLMQIMPVTAQFITGNAFFDPERLHEPAANLAIGQRYVAYLSQQDGIDNDLIKVLASYNSGPGSFMRWESRIQDDGDPLLFIEAIPVAETRNFVAHALTYAWIYAARMHLPATSLDDMAAGEFPRFTPASPERKMAFLTSGSP